MKNFSRTLVILAVTAIVIYILWYFADLVSYIFISWILSMLGHPLMRFFTSFRIGRVRIGTSLAALMTLLCFFITFSVLISLFVPLIVEQARNLSEVDYYALYETLEEPIYAINQSLINFGIIAETGESPFERWRGDFAFNFEPAQLSTLFGTIIGTAGNLLVTIFALVFITFFFLKDQGLFLNSILAFTPSKYDEHVRNTIEQTRHLLTRYFGGIILQISIITLVVSTSLAILGIPNALLIGFFAALINVIPYLGPIIGATFGILIAISSNLDYDFYTEMVPMILKVLLVFACMQMLDNIVLQPLIFSTSVMAHPLEIFIVIMIGAKLGGIVGMVVAIPVYTILRVIARVFLSEFQVIQQLTKSIERNK